MRHELEKRLEKKLAGPQYDSDGEDYVKLVTGNIPHQLVILYDEEKEGYLVGNESDKHVAEGTFVFDKSLMRALAEYLYLWVLEDQLTTYKESHQMKYEHQ